MAIDERRFASIELAANTLADELAADLREAIAVRGRATLAVSGGNTPRHVFKQLRSFEMAWEKVRVTLIDERWVPVTHPDSNEKLVRENINVRGT